MSEIEKAREALRKEWWTDGDISVVEHFVRLIAREETEAHEAMLLHESIHGNIDAEDTSLGRMTALARRLAEALEFLVTRCEHRPTGPNHAAMLSTQGWREREALSDAHDVLAEARKAGLIE